MINVTSNTLSKQSLPSPDRSTSTTIANKILQWKVNIRYDKDQQVIFRGKICVCIQKHISHRRETPDRATSFWQRQDSSSTATTTMAMSTKKTTKRRTATMIRRTNNSNVPEWEPFRFYAVGDRVTYHGKIYRCRQSHTSLSDWMPPVGLAL